MADLGRGGRTQAKGGLGGCVSTLRAMAWVPMGVGQNSAPPSAPWAAYAPTPDASHGGWEARGVAVRAFVGEQPPLTSVLPLRS